MSERKVPVSYFDSLEHARTSLREESLKALETQLGVSEWLRSSYAETSLEHFVASYGAQRVGGHDAIARTAAWLRQELVGLVPDAPTYFVSRDMTEMVKMAAEGMPREGITPIDLLTDSGFLYFHHPIEIVGPALTIEEAEAAEVDYNLLPVDRTERYGIRAIAWKHSDWVGRPDGTTGPGVSYFLFTDVEPIYGKADIREEVSLATVKREFGPVVLYDFSGWTYGLDWEVVPYDQAPEPLADPPKVHPVVDQIRLVLLSTWRLLSQKIVMLETQRPPRHLRRRASRHMPGDGDVTVIRLRREYHPAGGEDQAALDAAAEDHVPWFNHRFLVRGHWKRQAYGEGRTERKLIWVAPYIKGDPSLPLVMKSRIYSLEQ